MVRKLNDRIYQHRCENKRLRLELALMQEWKNRAISAESAVRMMLVAVEMDKGECNAEV